jgi:hypothetical protein
MRPHVSAETMARFRQGDLSQRRSSHIGRHLAECARCGALNEDLAGVTTLLADAQPPPMPEHLAARIQTAVAAEAARRVTAPAANKAAAHGRSRLPRPARTGSRVALGGLAAAAAVVLVAGGVYEITQHGGSSASPSSSAASAPAARPAGGSAGNGAMMPAAPAFGPVLQYRHAGRLDSISPVTTGTYFTQGKLTSQVAADVTKYGTGFTKTGPNATPASRAASGSPAVVPGEHAGLFGGIPVPALRGCVNRIAAGDLVLLVDVAHYRGAPATVIVTEVAVTGPMQIWVVGTGCSASRSDVLTRATTATPN